jgi:hypothetical protein
MADLAQATQTAQQLAQFMRSGGQARPQQQAPMATMQPAKPSGGGIVPGSGGMRLTGSAEMDSILLNSFAQYAQLWSKARDRLLRENPSISPAEIEAQIGLPPSRIKDMREYVDRLGSLQEDPAQKQHDLDIAKMKVSFDLNAQSLGIAKASEIAVATLKHKFQMQELAESGRLQKEEGDRSRAAAAALEKDRMAFQEKIENARREMDEKKYGLDAAKFEEDKKFNEAQIAKINAEAARIGRADESELVVSLAGKLTDLFDSTQKSRATYVLEEMKIWDSLSEKERIAQGLPTNREAAMTKFKEKAKAMFSDEEIWRSYNAMLEASSGFISPETVEKLRKLKETLEKKPVIDPKR